MKHQFLDGTNSQLTQEVLTVRLHGPWADTQLAGNLLAGRARESLIEHLPFSFRQGGKLVFERLRRIGQVSGGGIQNQGGVDAIQQGLVPVGF